MTGNLLLTGKNVTYTAVSEDFDAFCAKLDRFAADLTVKIYRNYEKDNLCISPVSVYMALALACECTSGATQSEILAAVGVTYEEVVTFTKTLKQLSYGVRYSPPDLFSEEPTETVTSANELSNALFAREWLKLKEDCVASLQENFGCDTIVLPSDNEEAANAISEHIKEKTHGLIDDKIDLAPEALFVLINTLYIKDTWHTDLSSQLSFTKDEYAFRNKNGTIKNTPLLQGKYHKGATYYGKGYSAFYTRTYSGLTLAFLLPDEGVSLDTVFTAENLLAAESVQDRGYIDEKNNTHYFTRVLFPSFEASFADALTDVLKEEFGIRSLFSTTCDCSALTDDNAYCSDVVHKTKLVVNETGIEGAAVTTETMSSGRAPKKYTEVYADFIVDRAFGFVLCDPMGTVLFSGAVTHIS